MYALIYDRNIGGFLKFEKPLSIISCVKPSDVGDCLSEAEKACNQGMYAVGFVSYEASPAFDPEFVTNGSKGKPLVYFGIFNKFDCEKNTTDLARSAKFDPWETSLNRDQYLSGVKRIKDFIFEGDTYQVNFTFKLRSCFTGDPRTWYRKVQQQLDAEYAAYLELEDSIICSFSPELFFTLDGEILVSKPMKGTSSRGLTLADDRYRMQELANSPKNRAENIMIVDMIRNDMGQIAEFGSVSVPKTFEVERHPYVLQMTSTVRSRFRGTLAEVFSALFPCGSITGAPKIRTMQIIHQLEQEPRGVYTGAIGYIAPNNKARFSVAIRTLTIDPHSGQSEYGVGSGIVWDSDPESEFRECLMKSDFLNRSEPEFQLVESLLWTSAEGYYLLEEHLDRLKDSAEYFSFPYDQSRISASLTLFTSGIDGDEAKVRLLLSRTGKVQLEASELANTKSKDLKVRLAKESVDSNNRFLYHKTTLRDVYDKARAAHPDCDDVILWNQKGEVTESCRSNVVVELDGELVTPPVECGLLAGTFRGLLLRKGEIKEKIVTIEEIRRADRIFTINSVRTWMDCQLS